jgi:hypothetical protein
MVLLPLSTIFQQETSTTDEGDNTTTMYIHAFYKDTRSEIFYTSYISAGISVDVLVVFICP